MRVVRYCHNNPYWGASGLMLVWDGRPYGLVGFHVERDDHRGWTVTFTFFSLSLKLRIDTPAARARRTGDA